MAVRLARFAALPPLWVGRATRRLAGRRGACILPAVALRQIRIPKTAVGSLLRAHGPASEQSAEERSRSQRSEEERPRRSVSP